MKQPTNTLTGVALDWAVVLCETWVNDCRSERFLQIFKHQNSTGQGYCYSRDWAAGGPIIEREKIEVKFVEEDIWHFDPPGPTSTWWAMYAGKGIWIGPTPLIAAMRCYVASQLGDEVDIPEELA